MEDLESTNNSDFEYKAKNFRTPSLLVTDSDLKSKMISENLELIDFESKVLYKEEIQKRSKNCHNCRKVLSKRVLWLFK